MCVHQLKTDIHLIEKARVFREKYINPIARKLDEDNRFPSELIGPMAEEGFFGVHYPTKYGGGGFNSLTGQLVAKELAKGSAGVALTFHVHWMAVDTLIKYGTESQKEKYLYDLIQGRKIAAFIISEVYAGSDVSSIKSKAVFVDGMWKLKGTKYFCTNGGIADIYLIACKTTLDDGAKGISMFIVEKETNGFEVGPPMEKMGCRSSVTTSLILKDCTISDTNIVGKVNEGFKVAMYGLASGRLGMASMGLGIAEAALEDAIEYANKRQAFGKPIGKLYAVQEMIADMYMKYKSAYLMLKKTADMRDRREDYSLDSSITKICVAEMVNDVTFKSQQIFGGHGYMKHNNVERYFRDARVLDVGVGSSEVLKMVIGNSVLKKFNEMSFFKIYINTK